MEHKRSSLQRAALAALPACLVLAPLFASGSGCSKPKPLGPLLTAPYRDDFNRADIGGDWNVTSNAWKIRDGALIVSNGKNHPMWLKRRLPHNVRIEFDAWSTSEVGDIKCEVFGDGQSYAKEASYTATSYVVIFGGWHNQFNVIARMNEHGSDRREQPDPVHVVPFQKYHWAVERRGNTLSWSIDGKPMLEFPDDAPLEGSGHEYFAFNNWAVELGFDNLLITPL